MVAMKKYGKPPNDFIQYNIISLNQNPCLGPIGLAFIYDFPRTSNYMKLPRNYAQSVHSTHIRMFILTRNIFSMQFQNNVIDICYML